MPTSSSASRSAVRSGVLSASSQRPPGKLICPAWSGRSAVLCVNTTVGSPAWFTTSSSTAAGLSDGPEFICFLSRSSAVSSRSSGGLAARRATMSARLGNLKVLPVAVEAMGNYKEGYDSTAMVLYDYFRSSAAYRVRIALNLKGLAATHRSIHLRKVEQRAAVYLEVNPQGLVPTLVVDGTQHTQSLQINEYHE